MIRRRSKAGRRAWGLAAAILLSTSAAAGGGWGPLPARNYHPLSLLFLNLPFESPELAAEQRWRFDVELAETNTIAGTSPASRTPLLFDLETTRLALSARRRIGPRLELRVRLPLVRRWGGFLDGIIADVERAVDRLNPARDSDDPQDVVRYRLAIDGVPAFDFESGTAGLADPVLGLKGELWRSHGGRTRVAGRLAVKLPLGDDERLLGSGRIDAGLGLDLAHRRVRSSWYGSAAFVRPGDPRAFDLDADPFLTAAAGYEYRWTRRSSGLLQVQYYGGVFGGDLPQELRQDLYELGLGVNVALNRGALLQLGAIENITVRPAADISIVARIVFAARAARAPE